MRLETSFFNPINLDLKSILEECSHILTAKTIILFHLSQWSFLHISSCCLLWCGTEVSVSLWLLSKLNIWCFAFRCNELRLYEHFSLVADHHNDSIYKNSHIVLHTNWTCWLSLSQNHPFLLFADKARKTHCEATQKSPRLRRCSFLMTLYIHLPKLFELHYNPCILIPHIKTFPRVYSLGLIQTSFNLRDLIICFPGRLY